MQRKDLKRITKLKKSSRKSRLDSRGWSNLWRIAHYLQEYELRKLHYHSQLSSQIEVQNCYKNVLQGIVVTVNKYEKTYHYNNPDKSIFL